MKWKQKLFQIIRKRTSRTMDVLRLDIHSLLSIHIRSLFRAFIFLNKKKWIALRPAVNIKKFVYIRNNLFFLWIVISRCDCSHTQESFNSWKTRFYFHYFIETSFFLCYAIIVLFVYLFIESIYIGLHRLSLITWLYYVFEIERQVLNSILKKHLSWLLHHTI